MREIRRHIKAKEKQNEPVRLGDNINLNKTCLPEQNHLKQPCDLIVVCLLKETCCIVLSHSSFSFIQCRAVLV